MPLQKYTSKKVGIVEVSTDLGNMTISTPRLKLTSINQHDWDYLLSHFTKLLSDPKNITYFCEGEVWEEAKVKSFLEKELTILKAQSRFATFAVHHLETKEFMGCLVVEEAVGLLQNTGSGHSNAIEMGYILDNSFWSQGFGTEMAVAGKKYIKHLLRHHEIDESYNEVLLTVHPQNLGSRKIIGKILKSAGVEFLTRYGDKPRLLFFNSINIKNDLLSSNDEIASPLLT